MRWLVVCLIACETAEPAPRPVPVPPVPVVPIDAPPAPPPPKANLQCYANGPKELIRIKTDLATMEGSLFRMTTGPVPDRKIRYKAVSDGGTGYDLVFVAYEPGDYQRMWNAQPDKPREKLVAGKSIVAHLEIVGDRTRIAGRDVDLATGMRVQYPDKSYPCGIMD